MSEFTKHVEKQYKEERIQNIQNVRKDINKSWVEEKINNYIERFDEMFTVDEIKNQILVNDLVASFFAKDPVKQNIPEKECSKWIGVDKLPAQGKNCIRFNSKGEIVATKSAGGSKSADFKIGDIYYTQKYTGNNSGGAQDNQYDDVVTFLLNGSIYNKVGAIVDGAYWDELGHREQLKESFKDNKNVIIVSADDLHKFDI